MGFYIEEFMLYGSMLIREQHQIGLFIFTCIPQGNSWTVLTLFGDETNMFIVSWNIEGILFLGCQFLFQIHMICIYISYLKSHSKKLDILGLYFVTSLTIFLIFRPSTVQIFRLFW